MYLSWMKWLCTTYGPWCRGARQVASARSTQLCPIPKMHRDSASDVKAQKKECACCIGVNYATSSVYMERVGGHLLPNMLVSELVLRTTSTTQQHTNGQFAQISYWSKHESWGYHHHLLYFYNLMYIYILIKVAPLGALFSAVTFS